MIRRFPLIFFLFTIVSIEAQAKQYYLANIIGTGVHGDAYRVNVATGFNYSAIIPSNPDGTPKFSWGVVIASTTLPNTTGLIAIPNISLDASTSTLTGPQVTAVNNALTNHGMPTTFLSSASTIRQFLRNVGQFLEANFDENQFDVGP